MDFGASRQIAQVKSAGGFWFKATEEESATPAPSDFAAGFKSISSISSSSRTMGVSFVPRAALGARIGGDRAAVVVPVLLPGAMAAVLSEAVVERDDDDSKRVERRCGMASCAIRWDAARAALRVDRRIGTDAAGSAEEAVESVDPIENAPVVAAELMIAIRICCARFVLVAVGLKIQNADQICFPQTKEGLVNACG